MPMYWSGPFFCRCECGWESERKKNPIAAQFAGEAHLPRCSFYAEAITVQNGQKAAPMINRDKYFDGAKFLAAKDVKDGQKVTIEKFEEIKTRIGLRPIVRLEGFEMPLGLNATNLDRLVELLGENEVKWAGKQVTLIIVQAPNPKKGGKEGPAIRVK
jgi:hypothetical protein